MKLKLNSCRIKQHSLPLTSSNFVQKCLFRLTMRSTLLARADSLDSLAAIIHSLCRGSSTYLVQWPIVTRSTFAGLCKLRTTKQGQVLSTNAMTVIRTGQQNCEDLELWKRVKSGNSVSKKSGLRSSIDEEAFVVFCLAAYVLTVGTLQAK